MASVMEHHPACRVEIEKWLTDNHATFTFSERPYSDFNVDESLRNQARIGQPLNNQQANNYKLAMERGDSFPAVVAYWRNRKLIVIDGNHRLWAHGQSGTAKIPVYLVDASPEIITKLTYSANVRNGLPTSHEERMHQAVHLVHLGSTIEDAADALKETVSSVRSAFNREAADLRAQHLGLRGWTKIPVTSRERLHNVKTDEGFKALAELVAITPLTTKDVGDLVTEINRFRSAAGQVEFVEKKKTDFTRRISKSAGNTLRKGTNLTGFARFMGALKIIDNLSLSDVAKTANVTTDLQEFSDAVFAAAEKLLLIADAVEEQMNKEQAHNNGRAAKK